MMPRSRKDPGKVAGVAAGPIGRSWAMVFARVGHSVTLLDQALGHCQQALPLARLPERQAWRDRTLMGIAAGRAAERS